MYKIVLVRHGVSEWNEKNLFTGWTDVDIITRGIEEARKAGKILTEEKYTFDLAFCSVLKRAIRTLWVILDEMDLMWIPVERHWRLNERHYGSLQGLNKAETTKKYGQEQVNLWRRSYATAPPALEQNDKRHPANDIRYKNIDPNDLPSTESLKDTVQRFLPYWENNIVPKIEAGKKILIASHGNTIRSLVKHLEDLSDEEIIKLNIPTGIPLVYELNENMKASKHYYLGREEDIADSISKVAKQASPN